MVTNFQCCILGEFSKWRNFCKWLFYWFFRIFRNSFSRFHMTFRIYLFDNYFISHVIFSKICTFFYNKWLYYICLLQYHLHYICFWKGFLACPNTFQKALGKTSFLPWKLFHVPYILEGTSSNIYMEKNVVKINICHPVFASTLYHVDQYFNGSVWNLDFKGGNFTARKLLGLETIES